MRIAPRAAHGALSRGALLLVAFAAACVLVPGLFWWGTTFTRELDDTDLVERLREGASARDVQHGIEELSRRFQEGRPGLDRWAEDLVRVSRRPEDAVRISAAWCMQFDATRDAFRERLRGMVADDASPMVRRNAATSLAKAGDRAALPVLRAMLQPFVVVAPVAGTVRDVAAVDTPATEGLRVATLESAGGESVDVRAPVPGTVGDRLVDEGATVDAGVGLVRLLPADGHMTNALFALALVGEEPDRARARALTDPRSGCSDDVRDAASWAVERIAERLKSE